MQPIVPSQGRRARARGRRNRVRARFVPEVGQMGDAVRQMRLCVMGDDYEQAVQFYRDVLGLPEVGTYTSPGGFVTILDAGRATLELANPAYAAYIDEVEVGRRVAGHVRVAFEVDDAASATARLAGAGAQVIAAPVETPWRSLNARLEGPAGLQLTLFQELDPGAA